MDFVPFTLFFMVSLLSFQVSVGKPAITKESNIWPETCTGKAICDVRPDDYPPEETLIQLYDIYKDKAPKLNQTRDRQGPGGSDCNPYDYYMEKCYMILDEKKEIRYALYIPGHYTVPINLIECKRDAPNKFRLEISKRSCKQNYRDQDFFVLTHDMQGLETVKSAAGIPSSCIAVQDEDY
ncbi:uncharacterized protein LOC133520787 [Cydia pomonella]|uniref:uncharacterized protein LOC133520787 n=1 Tax=Cydia pomonella TaxID=82600 RepID=UPI002ADD6E62|nr:uncharacterized protein LOC133520787 [Cydia pomonella]